MIPREEAQKRADRIKAFREELAAVERDGALSLTAEQHEAVVAYHSGILGELARAYDVDRTTAERDLSLGMRIVSLLGAAALTGAVVLFFLDIWASLPTAAQVGIAWGAPIFAVAAAAAAARIERTLYFTAILAFLATGCYVLDVSVLGTVLNARPSSTPLLVWAVFASLLAYAWDLSWLIALAAISFIAFFASTVVWMSGFPVDVSLERPETVLVPAVAVFASSLLPLHQSRSGFPIALRRIGLAALFIALLAVSEIGWLSFLPWSPRAVEHFYQMVAFGVAATAIWLGIHRGWPDTLNMAAAFFGLLLLLRYLDWWWDWMPTSLFFFIVAATAIGCLLLLRRIRARVGGAR